MLGVVWQWVRDQLYAGVVAAGYDDLNAAHVGLWRYPGLEGLRPSQLADRRGITKQSVNDLLAHLEQHGYLMRVPDPADGRARGDPIDFQGVASPAGNIRRAGRPQLRIAEILGRRASPSCTSLPGAADRAASGLDDRPPTPFPGVHSDSSCGSENGARIGIDPRRGSTTKHAPPNNGPPPASPGTEPHVRMIRPGGRWTPRPQRFGDAGSGIASASAPLPPASVSRHG